MANDLRANPLRVDTAAAVIAANVEGVLVQGLEWVSDSGAAMAAADTLVMTINEVPINLLCVIALSQTWVTHFVVPIRVYELTVATIDGGALLVWKA